MVNIYLDAILAYAALYLLVQPEALHQGRVQLVLENSDEVMPYLTPYLQAGVWCSVSVTSAHYSTCHWCTPASAWTCLGSMTLSSKIILHYLQSQRFCT